MSFNVLYSFGQQCFFTFMMCTLYKVNLASFLQRASVHGRVSGRSLVPGFICPWFGFTCSEVHLYGVHLSGVQLSGGSFVRGFTCPYFSSTMTFLAEIEAVLMKRIQGLYRFGVATPRGRHSQGDAAMLKYTWAMVFCWSIVAKFLPPFSLYFSFC